MLGIEKLLADLPLQVASALATAALLAGASLFSGAVRRIVFYKRHNFSLSGPRSGADWDIQWDNLRVTIAAETVHNDHLEKVNIRTNNRSPGVDHARLEVSSSLIAVSGPPNWFL